MMKAPSAHQNAEAKRHRYRDRLRFRVGRRAAKGRIRSALEGKIKKAFAITTSTDASFDRR